MTYLFQTCFNKKQLNRSLPIHPELFLLSLRYILWVERWNHSILGRWSHHEDLCVSKHWGADARHSSLQGARGATATIGSGTPGCSTRGGEHDPETCINSWESVYLRTNWRSNCTQIMSNGVWVVSLILKWICRKNMYAVWVSHFTSQLMLFLLAMGRPLGYNDGWGWGPGDRSLLSVVNAIVMYAYITRSWTCFTRRLNNVEHISRHQGVINLLVSSGHLGVFFQGKGPSWWMFEHVNRSRVRQRAVFPKVPWFCLLMIGWERCHRYWPARRLFSHVGKATKESWG